jgi:hypothetical protein
MAAPSFDLNPLSSTLVPFVSESISRFSQQHAGVEIRTVAIEICSSCEDALTAHLSLDTAASLEAIRKSLVKYGLSPDRAEGALIRDDHGAFVGNPPDFTFPYFADHYFDAFPNICWDETVERIIGLNGQIVWRAPGEDRDAEIETAIRKFLVQTFRGPGVLEPLLRPLCRANPFRFGIVTEDGPGEYWVVPPP